MRIFEIETRHFDFRIVAKDKEHFEKLFRAFWPKHLESCGRDFDPEDPEDAQYLNEIISDAWSYEVREGIYRDGDFIQ